MKYLLDTDTAIYFLNGRQNVRRRIQEVGIHSLAISSISIAELFFGAARSNYVEENTRTVERLVSLMTVLPFDVPSARVFGFLKATLRAEGKTLDDVDTLIASAALVNSYVLVTNNEKHFRRISDLQIENWTKYRGQ